MEEPQNRMATPVKRGRPAKFGVGADEEAKPAAFPQPVEEVELEQPAITGIRCPSCGRGMVPRRESVHDRKVYAHCTLCGARMVLTLSHNRYSAVRRLG